MPSSPLNKQELLKPLKVKASVQCCAATVLLADACEQLSYSLQKATLSMQDAPGLM